jgi:hypothetical protein
MLSLSEKNPLVMRSKYYVNKVNKKTKAEGWKMVERGWKVKFEIEIYKLPRNGGRLNAPYITCHFIDIDNQYQGSAQYSFNQIQKYIYEYFDLVEM